MIRIGNGCIMVQIFLVFTCIYTFIAVFYIKFRIKEHNTCIHFSKYAIVIK